ncbi:6673_t:CDS:2, partial [Racocetra fulgida]
MYVASTAVYLAEIVKIIACLAVILYQARSFRRFWYIVQKEILGQPHETLKMFIPSALYALQNNLLYVALSNLEAATFQVTYQMKILSTAIFSVVLLERKITNFKWFALVLLMIGVTLVQLQTVTPVKSTTKTFNTNGFKKESNVAATTAAQLLLAQNPLIGLFAVITSCVSSGFAGCYFEKILKKTETSMWIRNVQLGITGALFSLIGMIFYDSYAIMNDGFLQGYDSLTYAVIANQALGGLLVAIVVKYADKYNLLEEMPAVFDERAFVERDIGQDIKNRITPSKDETITLIIIGVYILIEGIKIDPDEGITVFFVLIIVALWIIEKGVGLRYFVLFVG